MPVKQIETRSGGCGPSQVDDHDRGLIDWSASEGWRGPFRASCSRPFAASEEPHPAAASRGEVVRVYEVARPAIGPPLLSDNIAVIALKRFDKDEKWLLTAFERKRASPDDRRRFTHGCGLRSAPSLHSGEARTRPQPKDSRTGDQSQPRKERSEGSAGEVRAPLTSLVKLGGRHQVGSSRRNCFALSVRPFSMNMRIASDRVISAVAAHSSICSMTASGIRIASTGSTPVAGRPRFFFRITDIDGFIFPYY